MESKAHELEGVVWGVIPITVYRGCLITKLIGGYEIWGTRCLTPQDIDQVIDKAGSILSESIDRGGVTVKAENGNFATTNSLDAEFLDKND